VTKKENVRTQWKPKVSSWLFSSIIEPKNNNNDNKIVGFSATLKLLAAMQQSLK
jgi:hypothetical protein